MRIVIMGDLQYEPDENINGIFDDINSLSADTVVCTGDYGWYSGYGSYEIFNKTAETENVSAVCFGYINKIYCF